jgi:hypothetical protein
MPKIVKWFLWFLVFLALYNGFKVMLPYLRFAHIKGQMKDACQSAITESDNSLAEMLADKAKDDQIPLVGDYFYRVTDENGKQFFYKPETEAQEKEYLDGAKQYFLERIVRNPGNDISISIEYHVEVYFVFHMYTYKIDFQHKEVRPLAR